MTEPNSSGLESELQKTIRTGDKITAIKVVKVGKGLPLTEAMKFLDQAERT